MIDSLRGEVLEKEPACIVIEAGGVGYACRVSLQTAAAVGGVGSQQRLYTRLTVREDEIALYGFASKSERTCFDQLTAVSGVGPKAALAILSDFTPDRFALIVAAGDHKSLTKSKGIGAKTAQRVVLELKDKVAKAGLAESGGTAPAVFAGGSSMEEAMAALQVLGYSQAEVAGVLAAMDPALSSSELIRLSLLQLGKNMIR